MARKRLSSEQAQELISRKQFAELLERNGWVTTDVIPDLGEDILVRVYDHGVSTGISCYIQLKSAQNLEGLKLKLSGMVSYKFEVADLEHWEIQGVPVLIVVWDVNTKKGFYIWAKDASAQLDAKSDVWRQQKTVNVHFPNNQVFEDTTLGKLRHYLAIYYEDPVFKGRDLEVKVEFSFPMTDEGIKKSKEFERHIEAGDSAIIPGNFISSFEFPDWWKNLHGEIEIEEVRMGPAQYSETHHFQFRFHSRQSETVFLSDVELRMEKGGEKELTFSNTHQNTYYKVKLVANKELKQFRISFDFDIQNIDGYQARHILQIRRSMSEGCKVVVRNLDIQAEFSDQIPEGTYPPPSPDAIDFFNKICRVQDITGLLFSFQEDDSYSTDDPHTLDRLVSVFDTGEFKYSSEFTIQIAKLGVESILDTLEQDKPLNLRYFLDDVSQNLLGDEIKLGPAVIYVKGLWGNSIDDVRSWLTTASNEDSYRVTIKNAETTEVYADWPEFYPDKIET